MMTTSYEKELRENGRVVFTVKGVSMRPLFHADTDMILVKRCSVEKLKNMDIVLFRRVSVKGEQYVLHRIVGRLRDGSFIIAGDNCTGADYVRPQDVLGIVASVQRKNRPIRLQGFRYRLYVNLWCKPYKLRFFILRCVRKFRSMIKKLKPKAR